jgi:hypothetical protein
MHLAFLDALNLVTIMLILLDHCLSMKNLQCFTLFVYNNVRNMDMTREVKIIEIGYRKAARIKMKTCME